MRLQNTPQSAIKKVSGFSLIELVVSLVVLLVITTVIIRALTDGLRTIRVERSFAERDADVKRAVELMALELSQAGVTPEIIPQGVTVTGISGATVNLATTSTLSASTGLYPRRPITLGLPEGGTTSESLIIDNVDGGCTACVTTVTAAAGAHDGQYITSPMLPLPFGILNPPPAAPIPGPPYEKGPLTRIGFVGDIFSNGNLYYVEYKYDAAAKRLLRTSRLLKDGSTIADVVMLDNVDSAGFTIIYSGANVPIPIDVRITVTAYASVMLADNDFKKITGITDVVPRGTAAAATLWVNGGESQLRAMMPPCSSSKYPPCTLWASAPWWQNAQSLAATLP